MRFKVAADLVVLIHLFWILFLILGAVPGGTIRWVRWTHIGGIGFSLLLQAFSWSCPLTDLERWLRSRHAPFTSYPGSFISHYAERIVYLDVPSGAVFIGTIGVALFSIWRYSGIYDRREKQV